MSNRGIHKHPSLKGIGISLAKCGIWFTFWTWTFRYQWDNTSAYHSFDAGFGVSLGRPYIELGYTSFDVRQDWLLTVSKLHS